MSILFKREFFDAIRRGRKTQTIRWWRAGYAAQFRPGGEQPIPYLAGGRIRIESIEPVRLADLGEADAAADGFDSLAQMRARLGELYPELADGRQTAGGAAAGGADRGARRLYRVRFRFVAD